MNCSVEAILGITEQELTRLSSIQRTAFLSKDGQTFVHKTTRKQTIFGQFEVVTFAELCSRVDRLPPVMDQNGGTLRREGPLLTSASGVDIGQLQATFDTSINAAMVQVASNFNCLENASIRASPDSGFLVDHACRDNTQGPAAVFGTLSAYLYRAHFYKGGQNSKQSVNLLRNVSQYFGVPIHGKLLLGGKEVPIGEGDAAIDNVVKDLCIGLHTQCPILFGRNKQKEVFHNMPDDDDDANKGTVSSASSLSSSPAPYYPVVDHVLTASINLWNVGTMSQACLDAFGGDYDTAVHHMVRVLLRASYEATYAAAILQQRKELYLTLVGGGTFDNPMTIIVEEMERAHHKWANHPASILEKVQLCLYSKKDKVQVQKLMLLRR